MNTKKYDEIMALLERLNSVVVCSVDKEGYPNAKAMLKLENDKLNTFYFSTNLSAKRTEQFFQNSKSSIYAFDPETFQGLMLIGNMTVCTDRESRERLWREGFEIYYPAGIDDSDYCVLKFEAKRGNYYHGLHNETFEI